jgi:hypothetical protein
MGNYDDLLKSVASVRLSAPITLPPTLPSLQAMEVQRTRELIEQAAEAQSAEGFVRRIHARLLEFANGLNSTQEVGIALVSFGQSVTLHVSALGYMEPGLIVFKGETNDGNPVQLIQHLHQISFLLMTVPAKDPDAPKRPIGFFAAE